MHICITGASGFIGRHLVAELASKGHHIKILTRHSNLNFDSNIQIFIDDLSKKDCSLANFLTDCDILFHCAGEINDISAMHSLHVGGTGRLIQAAKENILRSGKTIHWVQLSSVGAYGPPTNSPITERIVTEETPVNPANEYEITKTKSDELVIQAGKNYEITYSILRPSNVFGTKKSNISLQRLINLVKRNLFFYVGKPGSVVTYVHVDDVVNALIACAMDSRAKGQIYNLSSDCTMEELINYLACLLKKKLPRFRVPEPLMRCMRNLLVVALNRVIRIPTYNLLVLRTRYPSDKIEKDLGFTFSKRMPQSVKKMAEDSV